MLAFQGGAGCLVPPLDRRRYSKYQLQTSEAAALWADAEGYRETAEMGDSRNSELTELADTLGQTGLDILAGAPVTVTEKRFADPKVLAIMLLSRSLANFKGVITLMDNGLLVEARILMRCCFENVFWIAALHAQGDTFVRKMHADEIRSQKVRGELALSKKPQLSENLEKRLPERLRKINSKSPNAKSLSPKDVALSGLLSDGYIIYCQLSADASHPTMSSLRRHIGQCDKDGEARIDVVPTPNEEEVTMTLMWACNAMIGVCVGVNEILGGTPAGQKLGQISDRYHALVAHPKA